MKVRVGDYKYVSVCVCGCVVCCLHDKWTRSVGDDGVCVCSVAVASSSPAHVNYLQQCRSQTMPATSLRLSSIKFAERVLKFFESSLLSARNQLKASC